VFAAQVNGLGTHQRPGLETRISPRNLTTTIEADQGTVSAFTTTEVSSLHETRCRH